MHDSDGPRMILRKVRPRLPFPCIIEAVTLDESNDVIQSHDQRLCHTIQNNAASLDQSGHLAIGFGLTKFRCHGCPLSVEN